MPEAMVASEAAGTPLRLEQRAKLRSFVGVSLKNGLLNILTLTLYRFWGRTEVRKRIWSSTYLNDEAFEYTGRGMELFIGFLIATGLTLVFLLVVVGVQFLGPLGALLLLPIYVGLGAVVGFAIFAATRYQASRTAWRGVRFQLTGSAVDYGLGFLGRGLLSLVTFGWYWPAAELRNAAPLWSGLRFGDRAFAFDLNEARKENIYGPYVLAWLGGLFAYALIIAAAVGMAGAVEDDPNAVPEAGAIALLYIAMLVGGLVVVLASAAYRAAVLRAVVRGIRFDGVRAKLKINAVGVIQLLLGNAVLLIFSLGFLTPMVQARTVRFVINRLTLAGQADLASVNQSPTTGPRQGEGLADAFDISLV